MIFAINFVTMNGHTYKLLKKHHSLKIWLVHRWLLGRLHTLTGHLLWFFFYALCPSQQFFTHVRTISCLPGLNQYLAGDKVSCSRTQHSDSAGGESRTCNPSSHSLASRYKNEHVQILTAGMMTGNFSPGKIVSFIDLLGTDHVKFQIQAEFLWNFGPN